MRTFSTMLILAILAILSAHTALAAAEAQKPTRVKNLVFGHAYEEDKNRPVRGLLVTAEKDGAVLGSGTTNESGLYEMVLPDRSDHLNLCVSSGTSKLKGVRFCETVSLFQKVGTVVGDVELRQTEQDFYTNAKGENLNERYASEIRNEDTERAYGEYERVLTENKDAAEERAAAEEAEKKAELDKAKYRMPANTEMTGPVKEMQVVGAVRLPKGADPAEFSVRVYGHDGEVLREKRLWRTSEFNFTLSPKESPVFLNPLSLEVSSTETVPGPDGRKLPKWKPYWAKLPKEKNIVTAEVSGYVPGPSDVTHEKKAALPVIPLLVLVTLVAGGFAAVSRGRTRKRRYDYE